MGTRRRHLKTPLERFLLESIPGKVIVAILSPAILPFYMMKKTLDTVKYCFTPNLDPDNDAEFDKLFTEYENYRRDDDDKYKNNVQYDLEERVKEQQRADQQTSITQIEHAHKIRMVVNPPAANVPIFGRLHELQVLQAAPPIPPVRKDPDDWRIEQGIRDQEDKLLENGARVLGWPRKRLGADTTASSLSLTRLRPRFPPAGSSPMPLG